MAKKDKRLKVFKGELSKITYGKKDILWFFQWLKLAVDLDGKNIEFGKSKKFTGGGRYGSATGTIKHKLKVTAWKEIDLKELKESKSILQMTDRDRFKFLEKMFVKYRHLFGDFTIRYVKTPKDLINDDNYFTVQIPISKNRVEIDAELDLIKNELLKLPNVEKKRNINFHRGIKHIEMKRLWEVYKYKQDPDLDNQIIAKRVGYKTGKSYTMKSNKKQTAGIRQVQLTYSSAKKLLLNIAKGEFPKNTI